FTNHLGTGKPSVQITPEGEQVVIAQISHWMRDENQNYTGVVIKAANLDGTPASAIVHYLVTGKPAGYETSGQTIVVYSEPQPTPPAPEPDESTPEPEPEPQVAGETTQETPQPPADQPQVETETPTDTVTTTETQPTETQTETTVTETAPTTEITTEPVAGEGSGELGG
ncbi:MAG: hypothetical protein UX24_C0017G0001, partial [Candidatus Giovannonibacteria bacterium GW2011_GWB1_45_9b]